MVMAPGSWQGLIWVSEMIEREAAHAPWDDGWRSVIAGALVGALVNRSPEPDAELWDLLSAAIVKGDPIAAARLVVLLATPGRLVMRDDREKASEPA
jgi:hypothetical protein